MVRARVTDGDERLDGEAAAGAGRRSLRPGRMTKDVEIELDIVGTEETPSAKLDDKPKPGEIERGRAAHAQAEQAVQQGAGGAHSSRAAGRDGAGRPRGARPDQGAQVGAGAQRVPLQARRRGVDDHRRDRTSSSSRSRSSPTRATRRRRRATRCSTATASAATTRRTRRRAWSSSTSPRSSTSDGSGEGAVRGPQAQERRPGEPLRSRARFACAISVMVQIHIGIRGQTPPARRYSARVL